VHQVADLSGDSDLTFTLTYPRPTVGPLKFFAQFVGWLVDGDVATVVLTNAVGDNYGWSPVSYDQPVFEVAWPIAGREKNQFPKNSHAPSARLAPAALSVFAADPSRFTGSATSPPPLTSASVGVSRGCRVPCNAPLRLTTASGTRLGVQTWPVAYWPDGSVK